LKELYIVRHAKSAQQAATGTDFERPLSRPGRLAAGRLADWLSKHKVRPRLVLCSPAHRARQTWLALQSALGAPTAQFDEGLYLASCARLLRRLRRLDDDVASVMLIGHNPGLHELALRLLADQAAKAQVDLAAELPPAACLHLTLDVARWREIGNGAAGVRAYVTPRDLGD
jgi:phosphohistidine phosphatase